MQRTAILQLLPPTSAERASLLATLRTVNAAGDWLAGESFAAGVVGKHALQKLHYGALRATFGLPAQLTIRMIAKVAAACKATRNEAPGTRVRVKPRGAIAYDARCLSFPRPAVASLSLLDGRVELPYVAGEHHAALLAAGVWGETKLLLRKGRWYLHVAVELPDVAVVESLDALGVDLGVVNLAVDSDGVFYAGATEIEALRVKLSARRADLQRVGTRAAHRALQRMGRKEATFRKILNYTLANQLVAKAKDTGRAIALEDLTGIRDRVTVSKSQRARLGGWAFYQLRFFLMCKAAAAGVRVVLVDPRNTSRTCPACGHCSKRNRRKQAEFCCRGCGYEAHADVVGALNIAARGRVDRPQGLGP